MCEKHRCVVQTLELYIYIVGTEGESNTNESSRWFIQTLLHTELNPQNTSL